MDQSDNRFLLDRMVVDYPYPLSVRICYKVIITGIYCIQNTHTDRCYVGAGKDLGSRLYSHARLLEKGTHSNSRFQADYNKYGKNAFVFRLLEEGDIDDLGRLETKWSELLEVYKPEWGYTDWIRPYHKRPASDDLFLARLAVRDELERLQKETKQDDSK